MFNFFRHKSACRAARISGAINTMKASEKIVFGGILFLGLFGWVESSLAADWYVSKNGNNSAGSSWATAWNELNQINWSLIQAGDNVYIDGGSMSMRYATGLTVGKGGSNSGRIKIIRSEEAGHNGTVYIGNTIYVNYPYVTIDGKDRNKFIIDYSGSGYIVRNPPGGNYFEFKNTSINTEFKDSTPWGTPFYSDSLNVLVSKARFESTNNEDQIKYNGTGGTMTIEDSYFTGLTNHGAIHEDIVQVDTSGVNLIVRRNFFMGQQTDAFMINSGTRLGNLEFYYNIFSKNSDAIKAHSAVFLKVYNNVFDSVRDVLISSTPVDSRNNIYTGVSVWNGPVHISTSSYSINDIGTEYWISGSGNIQADPLFKNKANYDYSLVSNSPAINAGIDVGLTSDILGNPIIGSPDIGAYEYISGGYPDTTPPAAPQGFVVQ